MIGRTLGHCELHSPLIEPFFRQKDPLSFLFAFSFLLFPIEISFWEVAMMERRNRVSLSLPLRRWRAVVRDEAGIVEVPLNRDIAIESVDLPDSLHGDSADRLIVATSRMNGWPLATRDARILEYSEAGHVSAVAI